jgi:membrane fusion protein (multidrug efflux system)
MPNSPNSSLPEPGQPPPRKRTRLLVVALALVAASLSVGIPYYLRARLYESTDDAAIEGHVVPVSPNIAGQVVQVHVKDNQAVRQGDLLVAIDPRDCQVRLAQAGAALASARARQAAAKINVLLTGTTSKADVEAATAGVAIAKGNTQSARMKASVARSKVDQAKAHLGAARATAQQAVAQTAADQAEAQRTQADLKRYTQLMATGSITSQQMDTATAAAQSAQARREAGRKMAAAAEAQVDEAQAALQAAEEGVKQAQAELEQAISGVTQAEARLAQVDVTAQRVAHAGSQEQSAAAEAQLAEANLKQAQLQLSYTQVRAPQAGRVARKTVQEGSYVQVGQAMLTIVPLEVWVVANFKETQLTHMRPGQQATVKVDAYPGRRFQARVDSLQAGTGARFSLLPPENATGNFVKVVQRVPVKIVFDEPPGEAVLLAPGMSVTPEVKVR